MNITRKLSLSVLTIGIAASAIGCSVAPPAHASVSTSATPVATSTATATPEISPTAEPSAPTTTASPTETIAAVPTTEPPAPAPAAAVEEPVVEEAPAPVAVAAPAPAVVAAPAPVQAAPVPPKPAPAPVQAAPAAPAPVQAAPVVSREVYVGLSGGQAIVDQGRGPVLFPLGGGFPPYVAEHDMAGGWARFGTLSPGMTVRMSGLVTGTYTVGQIINVPKGGSTADLRFSTMPKVMLQTCIPGTSRMIVVGLY